MYSEMKYAAIEHVVFQPNNGGTISILQIFLRKPVILQPLKPSVQVRAVSSCASIFSNSLA